MEKFDCNQIKKLIILFLLSVCLDLLSMNIKVGLYESEPAIFTDASGQPAGFYIDILNKIAADEGWKIEYVKVTWAEGLGHLEKNEIDVVCNMGLIPERIGRFSFPDIPVLNTYSAVYTKEGSGISSILDLKDKSVAVLDGSTHELTFIEFSKGFDLNIRIIPVKDHETAFAIVDRGEADAALTKNITAVPLLKKYRLVKTPIIFNAQVDHFGLGPGDPKGLVEIFDRHLSAMKADKNSVYYAALAQWIEEVKKEPVPRWMWLALSAMGAGLIVFMGINYYLKREVNRKTLSLSKSEENLRITLESIGDGVISTDTSGRIVNMNKTAVELTGWSLEDAQGKPLNAIFRIVNADTRQEVANPAELVIAKGKTVGLANHTVLISKDGREYQIADSAAPIRDDDGNIHGVILVFSDVTIRYKTENEIRTVKEQFEYVLKATNTGFDIIDDDFNVIYVDSNWVEKLGDPSGKKCYDYYMGRDELCPTCAIPEVIRTKGTIVSEEFLEKENRTVEVHTIPLRQTRNGKKLVAEFNIDITERKNKESELQKLLKENELKQNEIKKLNESLEKKVADRTRDLEISNRELASFAYSVSHDLRAPLRHINGFARSMEELCRNCPKEALDYLKKISESALDMGALIDDLIEYSKTGRAELKLTRVDMGLVTDQLRKKFDNDFPERDIDWIISELPAVLCDENLIRSAWQNLMENAVKYTSKKEKAVIEINSVEKGDFYEFIIKDNGAGFDMKFSEKLFGVFHRLHSKSDYEGTGIGLANVRRIIERHGGAVRAESEGEGKGACFYFTIPKKEGM